MVGSSFRLDMAIDFLTCGFRSLDDTHLGLRVYRVVKVLGLRTTGPQFYQAWSRIHRPLR